MFKRIQKMLRNRKGFTLVELIVVIAILGILATVAVPRVIDVREDAEAARDAANQRIVKNAAALWLAEHGAPDSDDDEEVWNGGNNQGWKKYLDEWPEGVNSVTIDKDGDITVN